MVNIKINNRPYTVPKGSTILEAARYAGIEIPTLCYLKEINQIGACRICMVEVKGARSLVASCVFPVNEGMEIFTNTEKVRHSRKMTLELILSNHDRKCLSCVRSGTCELQKLCKEFGVDVEDRFDGEMTRYNFDDSAAHMVRDNNKCILCRRCIAACDQQGISVIGANARGFDTHVSSAFDKDLADVSCISCGQCIVNCPTGAIVEKDDTDLQLALKIAIEKGAEEILIIGGIGGRVDHTIGNIQNIVHYSTSGPRIEILDPNQSITVHHPGTYTYRGKEGMTFSAFAYTPEVTGVTYHGAYYPLDNHTLTNTFPLGISNHFLGEEITVTTKSGILIIVRTLL